MQPCICWACSFPFTFIICAQTHTRQNKHSRQTEAGPQILRCSAGEKSPECLCEDPGLKLQEGGQSHRSSPGLRSIFLYMSEFVETRGQRVALEGKTQAFHFFSFLFSYAQNCFLFPTFFFHLRGKGVLVLITWLQFTWDKTKDAKKGEADRDMHSWSGFPYHS